MKKKLNDYQILKNQKEEAWAYMNKVLNEVENREINKRRILQAIDMIIKADWDIISSKLTNIQKDELINFSLISD